MVFGRFPELEQWASKVPVLPIFPVPWQPCQLIQLCLSICPADSFKEGKMYFSGEDNELHENFINFQKSKHIHSLSTTIIKFWFSFISLTTPSNNTLFSTTVTFKGTFNTFHPWSSILINWLLRTNMNLIRWTVQCKNIVVDVKHARCSSVLSQPAFFAFDSSWLLTTLFGLIWGRHNQESQSVLFPLCCPSASTRLLNKWVPIPFVIRPYELTLSK